MSDEMAIDDKTPSEDQKAENGEKEVYSKIFSVQQSEPLAEGSSQLMQEESEDPEDFEDSEKYSETDKSPKPTNDETEHIHGESEESDDGRGIKRRASTAFSDEGDEEFKGFDQDETSFIPDYNRLVENVEGNKRRKSTSSEHNSETGEDFKGFEETDQSNLTGYNEALERLEAELSEAVKGFTPLKIVTAIPTALRASKRPRQDTATDGSRPSSALSSRSEGEAAASTDASTSPAARGRRPTAEMSSPLLRVPLERGWRRELVYRAALDAHSRRNADIYYYTPAGKKLRSMREIIETLSGTGLTAENFSFFKEPLGIDDPEKEIIRDAKMIRRVESPVPVTPAPTPVEGKRTPKPKAPKGASPEPATPKSPPSKIKVKSMGSRLSNSTAAVTPKQIRKPQPPAASQQPAAPQPPAATAAPDNNNTATWKKPRGAPPPPQPPRPAPQPPPPPAHTPPLAPGSAAPPPPPLAHAHRLGQVQQQPCSMACGRGAVPSLACAACLCLYHPACVGAQHQHQTDFLCKNCRKTTSPPAEPPPLTHKSGVTQGGAAASGAGRRVPVPVPVPAKVQHNKRPVVRMKTSGVGGATGGAWGVSQGPQALAVLNGRRFIVVARPASTEKAGPKGRLANGAALSPRRRGRPRLEEREVDQFGAFCRAAAERNYDVGAQIFQYLGMRDVGRCARVCSQWRRLAGAPALWRRVRMKNSHVSDWGGLCKALKKNGTKWLDLRKMLLPQNDTQFWDQFAEHIGTVDSLERLELCRCPARAVEAACGVVGLRALSAPAIRDARLDPSPLARLPRLELLRLKSLAGLSLASDLRPLAELRALQHLSLTSIKELGWCACEVVGQLDRLESLELGECSFGGGFAAALTQLSRLRRLRLERGVPHCAAPALLRALADLPSLTTLELVNFDVKVGFDDALAECKNIQKLLIIPTYVSQSATTNKQVLSGVLRLKETLTHLMWGVTIELLRVTELFIDQCEAGGGDEPKRRDVGECIPVLKPVPGCRLPEDHRTVAGPPQVEILPIPTLQRLLSAQLPHTKLKLLRIPFHATWRQSLADFQ